MSATLKHHVQLASYNSFGVEAEAASFIEVFDESDLSSFFKHSPQLVENSELLVLGGGSNILFTGNFSGLILKMSIPGISYRLEGTDVYVTAGGGVVWNDLVWYCINQGFAGIENLALIPGTAGAAPVQNIGAYGVELMEVFHSCRAFDTQSGEIYTLFSSDCKFTYRNSIFKNEAKGKFIITQITLKLSTVPNLNLEYGAIREELQQSGIIHPTIADVARAVSRIRTSKLPDPSTIGNAGSFFKNPLVDNELFSQLKEKFPTIVHYPQGDGRHKIAAGWLIEYCGWKGKRMGNCGTWKNQALVLVNHGGATGTEILELSERIIEDVYCNFGITLEREVVIR